jgi:exosortase/archaeosortase family protein
MSIVKRWQELEPSKRFLITYPLWGAIIFGLFYWGKYWSLSPIGEFLDLYQRGWIMEALRIFIPNEIIESYRVVINPKYHIIITPECNGLVPYFIFLSGVLAYPKSWLKKLKWGVIALILFNIVNFLRLVVVILVANNYGYKSFFYIHDIAGNFALILLGTYLFRRYLDDN